MILASKNANEKPFLVMLTAGTTVLGSFDPIEPVADICQTHGLWLHVDVRYIKEYLVFKLSILKFVFFIKGRMGRWSIVE